MLETQESETLFISAGFIIQQLGWLGSAAVLYTQKALSKADIAALFLSRKILLDEKGRFPVLLLIQECLALNTLFQSDLDHYNLHHKPK